MMKIDESDFYTLVDEDLMSNAEFSSRGHRAFSLFDKDCGGSSDLLPSYDTCAAIGAAIQ